MTRIILIATLLAACSTEVPEPIPDEPDAAVETERGDTRLFLEADPDNCSQPLDSFDYNHLNGDCDYFDQGVFCHSSANLMTYTISFESQLFVQYIPMPRENASPTWCINRYTIVGEEEIEISRP